MTMPVFRWIRPSTIAPMSTVITSVIGLNRHHSSPHPSGLPRIFPICASASPKNPPVSMPMMNVEMPEYKSSWQKLRLPLRGCIFFIATTAARIMISP